MTFKRLFMEKGVFCFPDSILVYKICRFMYHGDVIERVRWKWLKEFWKKVWAILKKAFQRYFVDAMSAMALGLFSSLIIGLIISQLAKVPFLSFMEPFAEIVSASSPVVGAAIGGAIAYGLKAKPLVIFSSIVTGAFGYSLGGPVGAYLAAVVGEEIGRLVSGKTKIDIVVSPLVTIIAGCIVGQFAGPAVSSMMNGLGSFINMATEMNPFPMGIIVSVVVGMVLTAPISSAALCIMLDLGGIAAGAATVGCCCQMVGFAVISFQENKWGGLLSQGLGTSMLQFGNILRHPTIWLPTILASAVLGPVSTCLFGMTNTAAGAGMGTSGLVGQFGTVAAMSAAGSPWWMITLQIGLLQIALPAVLSIIFWLLLRKIGWIKDGYMKLEV